MPRIGSGRAVRPFHAQGRESDYMLSALSIDLYERDERILYVTIYGRLLSDGAIAPFSLSLTPILGRRVCRLGHFAVEGDRFSKLAC